MWLPVMLQPAASLFHRHSTADLWGVKEVGNDVVDFLEQLIGFF